MTQVLIILRLTFHEAWRRRVVLLALALSVVFLCLYALGFGNILRHGHLPGLVRTGAYNFLLLAGLYVVHFLTIVLAIFLSVDSVSGEIASHTVQAMLARPLRRWQMILGKWLGYVLMMGLYIVWLSGSILAITYWESGYVPPHAWAALALPFLEAVVLISLSLLGGVRLATMTNGVALFLLYGLAFIGTWVEQIGSFMQSPAAVRIGIVTSLLMPVEALWRRTAYLLQPPIISQVNFSPFSAWSVPSASMVVYAGVYALVALTWAMRSFSRRDL